MKAASCKGVGSVSVWKQTETGGSEPNFPFSKEGKILAGVERTYGIAMQALKHRAKIQPGDTLVVVSADCSIGVAAVEIGGLLGARVIAVCATGENCEMAWSAGAHELVNLGNESFVERIETLTKNDGINVVFSATRNEYLLDIVPFLRVNPSIVVSSEITPELPYNKNDYAQMSKWFQQGLLLPQEVHFAQATMLR